MTKTQAQPTIPETPEVALSAEVEIVVTADVFMFGTPVPNQQRDHHVSYPKGWRGFVPRSAADRGRETGGVVWVDDIPASGVVESTPEVGRDWASMDEATILAHLNQHPEDVDAIGEFEINQAPGRIRENVIAAVDSLIDQRG